jgi:hypothetical protein
MAKGETTGRGIRAKHVKGAPPTSGEGLRDIPPGDPGLTGRMGRARATKEAQQAARIEAARAFQARKRQEQASEAVDETATAAETTAKPDA